MKNISSFNNQVLITNHLEDLKDVLYNKESIQEIDFGLANIYLVVTKGNELLYKKIVPQEGTKSFGEQLQIEDSFLDINYVVKIIFINNILFYDVNLMPKSKSIIKVLFGQNLNLNTDNLKYPFLNAPISLPPNGDIVIVGPLDGTTCYLQSGSISGNVKYHNFYVEGLNSHYLLESPWMEIMELEKLIFYEKIIFDIKEFFGSNIDLSQVVKIYQSLIY